MKTTDDQTELFIIVDELDNVLGYKTREECHHDRTVIHRAVGVILFNKKGEILFQKRSKTKDLYPGMYAISSSGHVSKGESYEEAALRELKEEMGIKDIILTLVSKHIVRSDKEVEMNVLYSATYNGEIRFFPEEVQSVHYFNKAHVEKIKRNITPCSRKSLEIIKWL
ncbi:MAG: NUDIX domain-containing protein [Patescibacteria group bacterium]